MSNHLLRIFSTKLCDVCGQPFLKGEQYVEPRNPNGTLGAVHTNCMNRKKSP